MSNNSVPKSPIVWPGSGTSTQLASAAGTPITVSPSSSLTGGTLSVGGIRNPIDANHTNVWYLDETGSTYANQVVGGGSLTGSALSAYKGAIFRQFNCIGPGAASTGASPGYASGSNITITKETDLTVEMLVRFNQVGPVGIDVYFMLLVDANNGLWMNRNIITNKITWHARKGGNGTVIAQLDEGGGQSQWSRGSVHHMMSTYSGTGEAKAYLDGELAGTASPGQRSASIVTSPTVYAAPGVYIGDLRISNVLRDVAYARAAYAAALAC